LVLLRWRTWSHPGRKTELQMCQSNHLKRSLYISIYLYISLYISIYLYSGQESGKLTQRPLMKYY
jgi:hypothetical protein